MNLPAKAGDTGDMDLAAAAALTPLILFRSREEAAVMGSTGSPRAPNAEVCGTG